MAYIGTGSNKAVLKLLHFAVSDVNDGMVCVGVFMCVHCTFVYILYVYMDIVKSVCASHVRGCPLCLHSCFVACACAYRRRRVGEKVCMGEGVWV